MKILKEQQVGGSVYCYGNLLVEQFRKMRYMKLLMDSRDRLR